jgi:serine phosphatase RsbU (regulator of sigma subunit)
VFSQTEYIDSVKNTLKKPVSNDTMRAFQYNELAWSFIDFNIQKASFYQQKGYGLSKKIGYQNGIVDAMNTKGIILRIENKPVQAIKLYNEIIAIRKKEKNYSKLIGAYSNLGSVYYESGNNAYALKFYEKAFNLSLQLKEEDKQLTLLCNLGVAYKSSGLYKQALETFKRGIDLNKKIKDEEQEAQLYINIATVYDVRKLYKKAIESNEYAYELLHKQNNNRLEGVVLYNLTSQYRQLKQYGKAQKCIRLLSVISKELKEKEFDCSFAELKANYFLEVKHFEEAMKEVNIAYSLADSITDPVLFTDILLTRADILRLTGDYNKALLCGIRALKQIQLMDDPVQLSKVYATLSDIYKARKEFEKALSYFEMSNQIIQQTTLDQVDDQIATLNSLNELDRKEKDLEIARQKNDKIELENKRKGALMIGGSMIGILILVLLFLSNRANGAKKKANSLLHAQNNEITEKKQLIEEKQKEILDSIHYAKRIQSTLLAKEQEIYSNIQDGFIYFQPKDIVSGDFYWCAEKDDLFYLAVCDSTGHGVPGAFMSLLNISFLNEAVNEKNILSTKEILNHVRTRLIANISQDGAQDGMDGVLFCFNKKTRELTYSAAYNAPVLLRKGEVFSFSADKMPIGKGEYMNSFTEHSIDLEPGDVVYAFTDGYSDQFGGERGKKFKIKELIRLFGEVSDLKCDEQMNIFKETFENWRGDLEQVDDVTVVGIRF